MFWGYPACPPFTIKKPTAAAFQGLGHSNSLVVFLMDRTSKFSCLRLLLMGRVDVRIWRQRRKSRELRKSKDNRRHYWCEQGSATKRPR